MRHFYVFVFFFLLLAQYSVAGDTIKDHRSSFFIQPEILIGKVFPGHSNFPETDMQRILSVSFGKYVQDPDRVWSVFYNYPSIGVSVSYSHIGNNEILGSAYTVMPFIAISTSKKQAHAFFVKLGIGASYFTKSYDPVENPRNLGIGSSVTWAFEASAHYNLFVSPRTSLSIGGGLIHHSNGHTQLPNVGLNSLLFSFSSRFYLQALNNEQLNGIKKPKIKRTKNYFISARNGFGIHVLGGAKGSTDNEKKAVYSLSISGGMILKQSIKLSTGFTYRFYQQYFDYLTTKNPSGYADETFWDASNLYFFVGCELFIGQVSMDSEVGINLYKPFYPEHSSEFEDDSSFKYWLKKTFVTRLGLKLYAINTSKNPKHNVFLGAHINANFGQADFSELSIGYVYRFDRIK